MAMVLRRVDQQNFDNPEVEQPLVIPARSAVGRWSVDRYISLVRPWVIGIGLAVIVLVLFRINQPVITLLEAMAGIGVGVMVNRRRGQRVEALTAGAITGLSLGVASGLSRFILEPTGYWFINILFETIIFGLVGAILSLATQAAMNSRKKLSP